MAKIISYTIGCYGEAPSGYFWSVPIKASKAWLQKVLNTSNVVGTKLSERQFNMLRRRVPEHVEVVWHSQFGYFLEANVVAD